MGKLGLSWKWGGPYSGLESGGGCVGLRFGNDTSAGPIEEPQMPSRSSSVDSRSYWRWGPNGTQSKFHFRESIPVVSMEAGLGGWGSHLGRKMTLSWAGALAAGVGGARDTLKWAIVVFVHIQPEGWELRDLKIFPMIKLCSSHLSQEAYKMGVGCLWAFYKIKTRLLLRQYMNWWSLNNVERNEVEKKTPSLSTLVPKIIIVNSFVCFCLKFSHAYMPTLTQLGLIFFFHLMIYPWHHSVSAI